MAAAGRKVLSLVSNLPVFWGSESRSHFPFSLTFSFRPWLNAKPPNETVLAATSPSFPAVDSHFRSSLFPLLSFNLRYLLFCRFHFNSLFFSLPTFFCSFLSFYFGLSHLLPYNFLLWFLFLIFLFLLFISISFCSCLSWFGYFYCCYCPRSFSSCSSFSFPAQIDSTHPAPLLFLSATFFLYYIGSPSPHLFSESFPLLLVSSIYVSLFSLSFRFTSPFGLSPSSVCSSSFSILLLSLLGHFPLLLLLAWRRSHLVSSYFRFDERPPKTPE